MAQNGLSSTDVPLRSCSVILLKVCEFTFVVAAAAAAAAVTSASGSSYLGGRCPKKTRNSNEFE